MAKERKIKTAFGSDLLFSSRVAAGEEDGDPSDALVRRR
jgi:hypothetical protein